MTAAVAPKPKTKRPCQPKFEPCPLCGEPVEMRRVARGRWENAKPHSCDVGPGRYRIPDDEVLAAYQSAGSVRRAAEVIGRRPATVSLRLRKMGVELPQPGGYRGTERAPEPLTAFVGAKVTDSVVEWLDGRAQRSEVTRSEALRLLLEESKAAESDG